MKPYVRLLLLLGPLACQVRYDTNPGFAKGLLETCAEGLEGGMRVLRGRLARNNGCAPRRGRGLAVPRATRGGPLRAQQARVHD